MYENSVNKILRVQYNYLNTENDSLLIFIILVFQIDYTV